MSASPFATVHRAPLLTRGVSTEPPLAYYHSVERQVAPPDVAEEAIQPLPAPHGRTTLSAALTPPSRWTVRVVRALPEIAIDGRFASAHTACSRKTHTWLTSATLRNHPAAMLMVFTYTSATLGFAAAAYDGGRKVRDLLVTAGARKVPEGIECRVGAPVAMPAALLCSATAVAMTLVAGVVACLLAVVAGIVVPMLAAPLVLAMPQGMRKALCEGLANYLILQQRFDDVEAYLRPSQWRMPWTGPSAADVPTPHFYESEQLITALTNLQQHIESSIQGTPTAEPSPPAQTSLHLMAALFAGHPNIAARIGVPPPPQRARAERIFDVLRYHSRINRQPACNEVV